MGYSYEKWRFWVKWIHSWMHHKIHRGFSKRTFIAEVKQRGILYGMLGLESKYNTSAIYQLQRKHLLFGNCAMQLFQQQQVQVKKAIYLFCFNFGETHQVTANSNGKHCRSVSSLKVDSIQPQPQVKFEVGSKMVPFV